MQTDLGFIGKNIRNLRRQRNWTMADLAAKIGMNPVPLGRIERGVNAPSASVIYRLAKALGVSVDTLFAEHDQDFRSLQHESSRDPFLVTLDDPDDVLPKKIKTMAQALIDAFWALEDICSAQKHPRIPLLIPFTPTENGMEVLSDTVRRYTGIEHGVVFDYFELFENQGLRVIIVPMPKNADSFSYYDPLHQ
ncbi:MAG: helix-turn-helix transcriptional regulator, partial [Deltaproteobacteria bacterium]|nr:helix-turn-helix transcriptional regulator [Deltaproteobacteria bacterium]